MKKSSDFRVWIQKIWQEHKYEVESFTGHQVTYELKDYLANYKWWLKEQYQKTEKYARN